MEREFVSGRVSIVVPCYNVEKYISRQLESILSQDYPDIEFIGIDDGSHDNTAQVIESYLPRFARKGWLGRCVRQDNTGQAGVINSGLALISGEYFVWPDADDFYNAPDAISKMVKAFEEQGDEIGVVRTRNNVISESGQLSMVRGMNNSGREEGHKLFYDCVYILNGFFFCAGAYMIRSEQFFKVSKYPISTPHGAGQNWQLLMPLLYSYDCYTIPEALYSIVEHSDSHGRANYGYEGNVKRIDSYEAAITETLDNMINISPDEVEKIKRDIHFKYTKARFIEARISYRCKAMKAYYSEICRLGGRNWHMAFTSILASLRLLRIVDWYKKRIK